MTALNEKDKYKLPDWIGAPPKGTHLDVVKESKLIQKLLIDEKGHYYFGRNPTDCDFVCEHASCSRVHAVLLYHKLIKRFAVVDLESSHGTFIENLRIGALAPVFINVDQSFHFGASKRRYFLRDKLINRNDEHDEDVEIETGFSKDQSDMDNATEANTARNRKIGQIPQTEEEARRKLRPRPNVKFNEEEDVINPEDIDPSVGRFRNMVRTAVIPVAGNKRSQQNHDADEQLFDFYSPTEPLKKMKIVSPVKSSSNGSPADRLKMYSSTLGSLTLNAAPDLELYSPALPPPEESMTPAAVAKYGPMAPTSSKRQMFTVGPNIQSPSEDNGCPSKKKYAKEAWPREMRRHNSGVL